MSLNTFEIISDFVFLSIICLSSKCPKDERWEQYLLNCAHDTHETAEDIDFKIDYRFLVEEKKRLPNAPHHVPLKQSMNLLINLASTFLHLYIDPRRLEWRRHSISISALNSFGDRSPTKPRPGESHIETGWYGDGNWLNKWKGGWEELWSSHGMWPWEFNATGGSERPLPHRSQPLILLFLEFLSHLKGEVHSKWGHYLLTLMSFQTFLIHKIKTWKKSL